jgi:hypothetical protein
MHPSNKENMAPSSSIQPKLSKSTTITCLYNVGDTFDKSVTAFVLIEQYLEFWNFFERSSALRDMISKCENDPYIMIHIRGHHFSNLTNYNLTLSIFDPNVATNLLLRLKGPPFG